MSDDDEIEVIPEDDSPGVDFVEPPEEGWPYDVRLRILAMDYASYVAPYDIEKIVPLARDVYRFISSETIDRAVDGNVIFPEFKTRKK